MAKVLGKDQATYSRERDGFLRDLQHFHDTRGTPFRRSPTLGGKEVDLYLLYTLVTAQGGWIKVNSKNSWSDLLPFFKLPNVCVNGSVALKQIYLRYLDRWEKVHFLGEEADRGSDDDEESRHKRWSARALHSVPYTYNYNQHNIADSNREYNHLATELYKPSDYDRLALSLISPLPNEQDFAINVCTLLSNDGKHTLKLEKHPRIITFLLGHAGVYNHSSLRKLFTYYYNDVRKKAINVFWTDALESKEFWDLTNEAKFPTISVVEASTSTKKEDSADALVLNKIETIIDESTVKTDGEPAPMEVDTSEVVEENSLNKSDSDSDCEIVDCEELGVNKFRLKLDSSDNELFCLKRTLGTQDYVGQRVLQIATILRNLSFIEENVPILVKNQTFIRFLLLCASSQWSILKNLGLDMLGNLAADFVVKEMQTDQLAATLIKIVTRGLHSEDRAFCISSLEVLNKLSQNEQNEDALLRNLEANVYEKVCSFLTIHDVMLLIYTLECLYSLSSLGERSCNLIVGNHGVVDTLVSLVTVEGKSYGPKACIGMKLVETLPSGTNATQSGQQQQLQQTTSSAATTTTTVGSSTVTTTATTTPVVSSTPAPKVLTTSTPVRAVQIAPQRLIAITPATVSSVAPTTPSPAIATSQITTVTSSASLTPQQLIQQQHAHQQTIHENEQFALAWLRATYEPASSGKIEQQELYKHYINSCSKIGRRGVISPLHFPRCVRSVFGGTVGPNPMKPANPNDPQYYEGIKVMAHPHLSQALLGSSSSTASTSNTKDSTTTTSIGASASGQSSTSLIKSLLATKVNDCMTTTVSMKTATDCQNVAQVAARQRLLAQQTNPPTPDNSQKNPGKMDTPKISRLNGARQLFADSEIGDPSVSSTTQCTNSSKGKKEPPQPPPPPLAPLSNCVKTKTPRLENEDSDSIGNNSLASSTGLGTVGIGGISSTEDGENSLTSFEGLLNGIPNIENPLNEDSNSKDSSSKLVNNVDISIMKPLRLADLLEKKFEKSPPMLNGVLGKEKSLDLVENHIEKALSRENDNHSEKMVVVPEEPPQLVPNESKLGVKRPANEEIVESEPKKPLLTASVNGSDSPAPESVSSSNGDDAPTTVSTAAAKLFADIAADILEDEDEEQLMQEAQNEQVQATTTPAATNTLQQIIVDNNQQVLLTQPRQIIVSQSNQIQQMISTGTLKTQAGQTVIVQNPNQQRTSMVLQQNAGQILLSQGLQGLQGQVQLVASSQAGQYVLQTSNSQGTYMVAQPQTAVVHGQPQTVLVAQTSQQQGTSAKTIIILQQQHSGAATHHQKVVVTPQGQQVVVTQVPRPVLHTSSVTNNVLTSTKVIKTTAGTATVAATATTVQNGVAVVAEKKEEIKTPPKPKIVRDLTTPFVCEWGECNVESKFKSANEVYLHVCDAHCPTGSEEIMCQWDRCDNMKRKRFSLMTHLHDKHCNTEAMKQSLVRRKQSAQGGKVDPPPPAPSTPHPGYAPDAALHAIKRHALEFVNPKELQLKGGSKPGSTSVAPAAASSPRSGPPPPSDQDDNEGPVTKSIRLTASLILRNLVIYSTNCRRYLKHYEPHLANVALSNVESSRTIAQVLYDMNEGSTLR